MRRAYKLSKQNHAPALPDGDPRPVLIDALRFLNQNVTNEWQDLRIDELLKMAVANWVAHVPRHDAQQPDEAHAFSNALR